MLTLQFQESVQVLLVELASSIQEFSHHSLYHSSFSVILRFQKVANSFPGSKLSKLKNFIPKVLKLTDEIAVDALKRDLLSIQPILRNKAISTKVSKLPGKVSNGKLEKCFTVPCLADKLKSSRLIITHNNSISLYQRTIPLKWTTYDEKFFYIVSRDKFTYLPHNIASRISKEHAKILGSYFDRDFIFEIVDSSKNGIFYLGNALKDEIKARKIPKNMPFKISNHDKFGILSEKNKEKHEKMLISFEIILF